MPTRALPANAPIRGLAVDLVARTGICVALLGAAVIHGTVASEHFQVWRPAGLFFLGSQVVEVSLAAAAIYAWQRRVAQLVFLTSVGTVCVWLVSRTVGMPIGPAPFRVPEAIGVPDLASCALELAAAALAVPMGIGLRRSTRQSRAARSGAILLAIVVAAAAAGVTVWGLQPSANPAPGHSHLSR